VGATGLAALAALLAALAVSRRLARPLVALIGAADAMRRGSREVRVGPLPGSPRELQDLAETFDAMADSLNRQEELRRALVSDVAHELRTPVAILQANLEALVDGVVEHTPAQTESLHEEVLRLGERVEDLQALARADAASFGMHVTSVDLARVAAGALEQLAGHVSTAGVDIRADLVPTAVPGDPTRLHQVVTNLLVNAFKFTPSGGRVEVEVTPGPDCARLVVRDTGVGIAPDDLPHVFERFRRGSRTADVPGSGIGLAIVAQLVAAHGGTVGIDSTPGAGTTVTVQLPYEGQRAASKVLR
jgi:two-component system, OmpR family, sensor histidine kinase BaeS